ncbi:hypothetical protein [Hydrogenophaga sp.]|jgi:hypothetical protein|uniref:hypothetical protein n=1 Tax=Hydrogenophaga sp. TaxID=1904254 RepID=UPI00272F0658|nr:hypothetical protein [Hydrogenophaga sp.]
MMSLISLPSLGTVGVLLCITLASYVQSLTGFAFGLIFLALVGVFDLIPVGVAANAVTLITLSQTYIYFREYPLTDDWRVIRPAIWPSLGGVVAGLALLFWLSDSALTGLLAGLMGGMFSTAGPPLVYKLYRQPLSLPVIRQALLVMFGLSQLVRLGIVLIMGQFTPASIAYAVLALPLLFVVTRYNRRYPLKLSPVAVSRVAAGLLLMAGTSLIATS